MKIRHASVLLVWIFVAVPVSTGTATTEFGIREARVVMELKRHFSGEVRFYFQFADTPEGRSFSDITREEFDVDPSGEISAGIHNVSTKDLESDDEVISWMARGDFVDLGAFLITGIRPIPEYELSFRDRTLEYRIAPFPPGQGPVKGIATFEIIFAGTVFESNAYDHQEKEGKQHLIWHERRLPEDGLHFRIRPD